MEFRHEPVLLQEVLQWMNVRPDGIYCDGTLGGGGHSEAILKASGGTARLYGIDRDETAVRAASERLGKYPGFTALRGNFHDAKTLLAEAGANPLDGALLDLGVSSPQLDTPERGFSYHEDAPLDMRMDRSQGLTAAELLNTASERELTEIIRSAMPAAALREKQHPAKRCFQAIRIEVNDELGEVERMMQTAPDRLNPGGRLCVISLHSLEDRIVKQAIAAREHGCTCLREAPVCTCGFRQTLKTITRKPILPKPEECAVNPRARSAKLRVAERI